MQADKVAAIVSQHGTILSRGESQDDGIGNSLLGLASFLYGQHVMGKQA